MELLKSIDWKRLLMLLAGVAISAFIGVRFQPMISNNSDAVNTVVTIFSILAGFLIAVITFIAEPTLKQAKNWDELQHMKATIRRRIFRQKILFFLYLLTLGVALAMYITPIDQIKLLVCMQTLFLGLATFVFLASFSLPSSLMRIQMERYEAALESSRPAVVTDALKQAKAIKTKS
ncbi:MAG: hypothetical protein WBK15_13775 [Yoonia sp.]